VKRYEGLFILNTAGKEEGIKEILDKVSAEVVSVGGRVDTVQKMDRRPFARVADRKHNAGFYANFIFQAPEAGIAQLRQRFAASDDIFRALFSVAPPEKPAAPAA
jgi:ribosomal protein S6